MEDRGAGGATRYGLSRTTLYRRALAGEYEHIARGLYRPTDAPPADLDLLEAAVRRPEAIVCLTSALAHHDLTDDIPDALDLAIRRGTRRPATPGAIRWHHFDRDTFDLAREPYPVPGTDLSVGIYSPERCIVDAFRLRGGIGYETGRDALRTWLARGGQPARLADLARRLPRAAGPVMTALDLLT